MLIVESYTIAVAMCPPSHHAQAGGEHASSTAASAVKGARAVPMLFPAGDGKGGSGG